MKNSHKEMVRIGEKILSYNHEDRTDYIARYEKLLKNQVPDSENAETQVIQKSKNIEKAGNNERICPRCGKLLIVRVARKGDRAGKRFWGCTGFPHCRYIENIDE